MLKNRILLLAKIFISFIAFYNTYLFITLTNYIKYLNFNNIFFIMLAVAFLVVGLIFRAEKMVLLINPLHSNCRLTIYKGNFIGSLVNICLPFKVGDLVRAHIMSNELKYSHSASIFTIVFERMIDSIFMLAIIIVFVYFNDALELYYFQIFYLTLLAVLLFSLFSIFYFQSNLLLASFNKFSSFFNDRINDYLRISFWSGARYLKVILSIANWKIYIIYTVLMWVSYFLFTYLVFTVVFKVWGIQNPLFYLEGVISPLLNMYSNSLDSFLGYIHPNTVFESARDIFLKYIWFLSILLPALAGVIFLFFVRKNVTLDSSYHREDFELLKRNSNSVNPYTNFLDEYFSVSPISRAIESMEINGQCFIRSVLVGGSKAKTILIQYKNQLLVRKISSSDESKKFNFHNEWLNFNNKFKFVPRIISTGKIGQAHYIDLEYIDDSQSLSEFINHNDISSTVRVLKEIIVKLDGTIYKKSKPISDESILINYVDQKVFKKIDEVKLFSMELELLYQYENIQINGSDYLNLPNCINLIMNNKKMINLLSSFNQSDIHGDLTLENILVKNDKFFLIDPNNENLISDKIVDYAKLFQSLNSGYEFLIKQSKVTIDKDKIFFIDNKSYQYEEAFKQLVIFLNTRISKDQVSSIYFHEGIHFCRLLPYRAIKDINTVPIFYAIATICFNNFIRSQQS